MADTFFGFDTNAPAENDGIDDIEDYDALNDETFGAAINGDWEEVHENLVLLDSNGNTDGKDKDETDDGDLGDLDFNIARMGLEDCEEVDDDNIGQVQLDPSVWAHPMKSHENHGVPNPFCSSIPKADAYIRQHFPNPFQQHVGNQQILSNNQEQQIHALQQQQLQQQQQQHQRVNEHQQQQKPMPNVPPKIMSVEDLERNIRNQQMQQKPEPSAKPPTPMNLQRQPPFPPTLAQIAKGQPLFMPQPHPNSLNELQKSSNQRLPPPGFPMNMLPQMMNAQTSQMHPNSSRVPPNLPMPLNNFNVHSNFNALRSGTPPTPLMQHLNQKPMPQPSSQQQQQPQQTTQQQQQQQQKHPSGMKKDMHKYPDILKGMQTPLMPHMQMPPQFPTQNVQQQHNQFNKRLVHEIQQNHPMLPFNRMNNNNMHMLNNNMSGLHSQDYHHNVHNQNHQHQQHRNQNSNNNNNNQQQQQPHHNRMMNGGLNQDFDEYANLMSNRDKQWLIGIQLSQLNTGTPYIDDFYYTVFKERRAKLKGIKENKAHKDNQLNHPLIQPKGHAQLVLISMGNKNGTNQQRNQRERKNSESNKDKETPRTYTPLQFENSLGKLQCGSVTAPRKIIDMDVVGADTGSPLNSSIEISTQRKSRQILLHIETLYRIALKLEDLENPTAIATALIVKERKEKERLLALEQERLNEQLGESKDSSEIASSSVRSSLSLSGDKEETREDLLLKLLAGLTYEKVAQMMTIRKGKTLIKRILPLIKDNLYRWDVWCAIFTALPLLVKKDRDDAETPLFILFPEFQSYIENASIDSILRLTNTLIACEKLSYIFTNKFSISCAIVLIIKMESVYAISPDAISAQQQSAWLEFLTALINAVTKLMNVQLANVAFENDIIKPLVSHFSRFRDLKSQPLIAVLTQKSS